MKFFLHSLLALSARTFKVEVGVGWGMCDLEMYFQFEYLASEHSPTHALRFLKGELQPANNDPVYKVVKNSNYYAPKAQFFASIQPNVIPCETFVSNGRKSSCVLSDLKPAVEELEVYEIDHRSGNGKVKYILYSTLSSAGLRKMVKDLGDTGFVFRPLTKLNGCSSFTEWIDLSGTAMFAFEPKVSQTGPAWNIKLPDFMGDFQPSKLSIDYSYGPKNNMGIAMKLSQVIIRAKNPAKALNYVTSNFPALQAAINAQVLKRDFSERVWEQQKSIGAGKNHVRINGIDINAEVLDYHRLVDVLVLMQKFFQATKLDSKELTKLAGRRRTEIVYKLDVNGAVYLNDIERDERYSHWPTSFEKVFGKSKKLISPRPLRRNLLTVVVFLPLDHPEFERVWDELGGVVKRELPYRVGIYLTAPKEEDEDLAKAFYRLSTLKGADVALGFLRLMLSEDLECDAALKRCGVAEGCKEFGKDTALPKYTKRIDRLTSWSNGRMTSGSIVDMKSDYSSELLKLEKAWKAGVLRDDVNLDSFLFDNKRQVVLEEWMEEIASEDAEYVNGKEGLWCPHEGCPNESTDGCYYYNGRQVRKREEAYGEFIKALIEHEMVVASDDPHVNYQFQSLLKELENNIGVLSWMNKERWHHDEKLSVEIGQKGAPLQLSCFLDPDTHSFPRLVLLFSKFAEMGVLGGTITLNPSTNVRDYLYKDFYAFGGELPKLLEEGQRFAIKSRESRWITTVRTSDGDLDNLTLGGNREVVFEVKHLVLEGEIKDATGAQLFLKKAGTHQKEKEQRTRVIGKSGYFQFKVQPGQYELSFPFASGNPLKCSITRFSQPMKRLAFPDGWEEDVVEARIDVDEDDVLNVYSVTSGATYERLVQIMALSVAQQKRGNNRLKFWLLDPFISPQFRSNMHALSQKLKFEYEFISYRWPEWLVRQMKINEVKAYKILFLDVIFPANVRRVVFVDSDQVARVDLTELAKIDLEGHVYGFVPFCGDKAEMAEYRFWERPGSYWHKRLKGNPYFIRYSL